MYRINNCLFQMYYRLAEHNQQLKMLFSHFYFMMKTLHYEIKSTVPLFMNSNMFNVVQLLL